MRKSILVSILAFAVAGCAVLFAACGDNNTVVPDPTPAPDDGTKAPTSQVHTWVESKTVEPTCGEAGRTYYTCSHCGHTIYVKGDPATGQHNMNGGVCSTCGYVDPSVSQADALKTYGFYLADDKDNSGTYSTGDRVLFGSYPQSLVEDEDTLATLADYEGTLPTLEDAAAAADADADGTDVADTVDEWTSYGYYDSGEVSDYMFYKDVTTDDGTQYRGVYMLKYRPYYFYLDASDSSNSFIGAQGYELSTVYWFKYEPICWDVLDYADGQLFLNSRYALEGQPFQATYKGDDTTGATHTDSDTALCDWESSTLRTFLNETFYNMAFSDTDKEMIQTATLDNKYTGYLETAKTQNAQNDTEDKVFLLSFDDVCNSDYGYSSSYSSDSGRRRSYTAYSTIQGCRPSVQFVNDDNEPVCYYTLRSAGSVDYSIVGVNKQGSANWSGTMKIYDPETWDGEDTESYDGLAFNGDYGILPALYIKIN